MPHAQDGAAQRAYHAPDRSARPQPGPASGDAPDDTRNRATRPRDPESMPEHGRAGRRSRSRRTGLLLSRRLQRPDRQPAARHQGVKGPAPRRTRLRWPPPEPRGHRFPQTPPRAPQAPGGGRRVQTLHRDQLRLVSWCDGRAAAGKLQGQAVAGKITAESRPAATSAALVAASITSRSTPIELPAEQITAGQRIG